jgi:hemerythrin
MWSESIESDTLLACMMIDADHFKEVNDTYGHDAGDVVLCELAKTLQHAVRNDDIVCRLGGDEFLIICPDTDQDGGMHIAELARKAVSALRVSTGDGVWNGSISVGLAARSPDMESHEDLIKAADKSVYEAKRDGRNCVRIINWKEC